MKYETDLPTIITSDDLTTVILQPRYCQVNQDYCAVTFSDKKRRYFTGTLEVDAATEGVGGIDVLPLVNLYFYKFYLVPSAGDDDQCVAIASHAQPDVGPAGFSVYRYVGRVRYVSADGWVRQLNDGCWSHVMYAPYSYEFGPLTDSGPSAWNLIQYHDSTTENLPPEWSTAADTTLIGRVSDDGHAYAIGTATTPYGVDRYGTVVHEGQDGDEINLRPSTIGVKFFDSEIVGRKILVSGCSNGGNNGTFTVLAVVSDSVITIENASGVEATENGVSLNSGLVGQENSILTKTTNQMQGTNSRQIIVRRVDEPYFGLYFHLAGPDEFSMWANGYWDSLLEC